MIVKMLIQTHRRQFCTPKPDADLCMRVDKKNVENQGFATGPLGRWVAGPWACFKQNTKTTA